MAHLPRNELAQCTSALSTTNDSIRSPPICCFAARIRIIWRCGSNHRINNKKKKAMEIYVPSRGVGDWQRLLADPVKHWAVGYSAHALAHCWQAFNGFPPEISRVLSQHGAFSGIEPLFIVPERQVALDNDRAPSQNDAWVLAKAASGLVSIAIEGKVNEPFDVTLGEWRKTPSEGRIARLKFLTKTLALTEPIPDSIRYQLLHRTASAVIEAQRLAPLMR
jgi:hypothetical protein